MHGKRLGKACVRLLALALCLGVVACAGSQITRENFDKIKTGMTAAQVTAIL